MKDKKKKKTALKKVLENRGFYIALFSLVLIAGFYVYAQNLKSSFEGEAVSFDENAWQEAVAESGIEVIDIDEKIEENRKNDEKSAPEKKEEPKPQEVAVETMVPVADVFSMMFPCEGHIVESCSLEELVYCAAMDDWRTHNGIDIAASEGEPVRAAEDGVVSKVYEDEFLGVVVEIEHEDGIVSLYGNLQSLEFINAGVKVKKGDVVGGVGKPGALEIGSEPHLHFEVQAMGEYKNPLEYMPQ